MTPISLLSYWGKRSQFVSATYALFQRFQRPAVCRGRTEDATCGQNRHLSRVSQGSPSFLKANLSRGGVVPESPYSWFHRSGRSRQISGPRSSSVSPSCPVSLLTVSEPLSMAVSKRAHLHYITPKPNRGWEVFIWSIYFFDYWWFI